MVSGSTALLWECVVSLHEIDVPTAMEVQTGGCVGKEQMAALKVDLALPSTTGNIHFDLTVLEASLEQHLRRSDSKHACPSGVHNACSQHHDWANGGSQEARRATLTSGCFISNQVINLDSSVAYHS